MRYPDGGGLTPAARAKCEQVRLEAAGLFAAGMSPPQVAKKLRVSRKSAYVWHHAWRTAGAEALVSKGPGGQHCRLNAAQVERLEGRLGRRSGRVGVDRGPAVDPGACHRPGRQVVPHLLHPTRDLLPAASAGLEPADPPVPRRRTRRRGDRPLGEGHLADGGTTARDQDAWICFADEAGQSLRPPKARTWSRCGCTPTVTVSGKGHRRVNLAGSSASSRGSGPA